MKTSTKIVLALALGLSTGNAAADGFALGAKVGTTGLGLEGTLGMTETINLRGGVYGLKYGYDFEEEGIDYQGDLQLRSAALMVDWHPGGRGFRVTAGAFANGNELKGRAEGNLEIGEREYDVRLDATIDWNDFAPYLGIGYGNAVRGGRVSFALDAGVMFTGSPDVRLSATGDGTLQDTFEDDLRREEQSLKDELSDFKFYPVINLGVSYRF
ncbi:membrane protein [Thioalkalivibrio sulfidiphilus]|uniref:membrane protein n=1 Tax=Thioalkalivibrio sulfidiphilus TaxID=1033854 RepID=UPI00036DE9DF|nr:membrane protein [Thioalkalivibrio sulfidiphilus]